MTQRSVPAGSQGIWVNSIRYISKNRGTLSTCNINVEIIKRNRVLMRAQKDFHAQIEQGLEPKHVSGWMTGRAINERTTRVLGRASFCVYPADVGPHKKHEHGCL